MSEPKIGTINSILNFRSAPALPVLKIENWKSDFGFPICGSLLLVSYCWFPVWGSLFLVPGVSGAQPAETKNRGPTIGNQKRRNHKFDVQILIFKMLRLGPFLKLKIENRIVGSLFLAPYGWLPIFDSLRLGSDHTGNQQ